MEKIEFETSRRIEPHMNRRFRLITEKLNEIVDAINSDTAQEVIGAVADVAETISDAPIVALETVTVDAAPEFNYLSCDDLDQLKAFADENDVGYDARATVSSLQKKITIKLGVAE